MKSRISFFNRGIAQNLLRRFWPLWAAYFCLLLLILPGELASQRSYTFPPLWASSPPWPCSTISTRAKAAA